MVARQAPLSMGFSRQEKWSGLLFPSPGDLPDPGTEPGSPPLQADPLLLSPLGSPRILEWVAMSSSRNLLNPGIEPGPPTLQADSLPAEPLRYLSRKTQRCVWFCNCDAVLAHSLSPGSALYL